MTATAPDRPQPLFRRLRRAWADAPFAVQALTVAVAYFLFLTLATARGIPGSAGEWVYRIIFSLIVGGGAVGIRRSRARRAPGGVRWVDLSEAVEDGRLPDDADPVVWRDALERRRAAIRQESWVVVVGFALLGGLLLALPGFVAASPTLLVLPSLLLAWGAWIVASRRRRLAQVDALLIPLQLAVTDAEHRRAGWPPPAAGDGISPDAG